MSTRAAVVHDVPAERPGTSRPRQEGPTDLRLVPPALAVWATAAVMLHAPPGWTVAVVTASLLVAAVLLTARGGFLLGRGLLLPTRRGLTTRARVTAHAVAATLLCAAAAAASAGLHGADVRRGPVPELAREYARAVAEVEVTADPRLTKPRVSGNHMAPVSVLIEADVRRVERAGAATRTTRAPVLLMIAPGDRKDTAPSAAHLDSPWLALLPSTRLRVEARFAPAMEGATGSRRCSGWTGVTALGLWAALRPRSGSRDGCAADCARRPRTCRRTRGRSCRDWSSGTSRG